MARLDQTQFVALLIKHQSNLSPQLLAFAEDLLRLLSEQQLGLESLLGNGLIPDDNFDFQKIPYTTNGVANTEDAVAHTLKRVPVGFLVINKDRAADLYASGTAWTDTSIYLKCTVVSAAVTIYVF